MKLLQTFGNIPKPVGMVSFTMNQFTLQGILDNLDDPIDHYISDVDLCNVASNALGVSLTPIDPLIKPLTLSIGEQVCCIIPKINLTTTSENIIHMPVSYLIGRVN